MPPKGERSADRYPGPPRSRAGNTFTPAAPARLALQISVGVAALGTYGMFASRQVLRTSTLMIGETRNDAPTWMAALAWVASRIVPAPTVSSGKASTGLRIWALGLTESKVTSIVIKPEPFAAATRSQTRFGGHWRENANNRNLDQGGKTLFEAQVGTVGQPYQVGPRLLTDKSRNGRRYLADSRADRAGCTR